MFIKDSKSGKVRFKLQQADGAKKVRVAGSFSGWEPVLMRRQKDGSFSTSLPLESGTYEYKFIVDGDWREDPENQARAMNEHGTFNSVANV